MSTSNFKRFYLKYISWFAWHALPFESSRVSNCIVEGFLINFKNLLNYFYSRDFTPTLTWTWHHASSTYIFYIAGIMINNNKLIGRIRDKGNTRAIFAWDAACWWWDQDWMSMSTKSFTLLGIILKK